MSGIQLFIRKPVRSFPQNAAITPMIKDRATLLQKAIISLVIAVLTFAKQIGFFLKEENRYYFLWHKSDSVALALDILLLAALVFGGSVALRSLKWDRANRIYNHVFLLVLISGLLTLVPPAVLPHFEQSPMLTVFWWCVWVGVVGICAVSFFAPRLQLVRYAGNVCMVLSPLVPMLLYQLLVMKPWSTREESDPSFRPAIPRSAPAAGTKTPVFVFVWDEWSYVRTFHDRQILAEFPNLRRFSEQAFNFHQAWSFSSRTLHSLPALVYQFDQRIEIGPGQPLWEVDGKQVGTTNLPSIFKPGKAHGYFTAMQGFYLPYRKMLGDQVDYCRSFAVFPRAEGLAENMWMAVVRNIQWVTEPVTQRARRRLEARFISERWFNINNWLRDDALRLIDESPRNTIAFFHWPLPHGPFVFNTDGSYHGQYPEGNILAGLRGTAEDYHRHQLYQDKVVGQVIDRLKKAGKYDDALIIFTADHSWRREPDEKIKNWKIDLPVRRAVLMVKFPGQTNAHHIDKIVYNNLALGPLVERALRGPINDNAAAETIQHLEDLPIPTGINSVRPRK